MAINCEHNFEYEGVIFAHGKNTLPGSGAVKRYYAKSYFCRKCLTKKTIKIPSDENSYWKISFGATPAASLEECLVPEYDR